MISRRQLILLFSGFLCLTGSTAIAEENSIEVIDPWIREAPPGMTMLGGYLSIKNNSDTLVSIVGSSSNHFKKVEIHKTEVSTNGISRMVRQERIEIPENRIQVFEPGGLHLMMMQPIRTLAAQDVVDVTFQLENGDEIKFMAIVRGL